MLKMVVIAAIFIILQSIQFMFATVMLKLKKIEITINPNYSSADEVL
jgi:hypothetical protein